MQRAARYHSQDIKLSLVEGSGVIMDKPEFPLLLTDLGQLPSSPVAPDPPSDEKLELQSEKPIAKPAHSNAHDQSVLHWLRAHFHRSSDSKQVLLPAHEQGLLTHVDEEGLNVKYPNAKRNGAALDRTTTIQQSIGLVPQKSFFGVSGGCCLCTLERTTNFLTLTYHLTALASIVLFGLIAAILRLTPVEIGDIEASRIFAVIAGMFGSIYFCVLIQAVLEMIVERIFLSRSQTEERAWTAYFFFQSFTSSFALLGCLFYLYLVLHFEEQKFSSLEAYEYEIAWRLLACAFIFAGVHILRKFYHQQLIMAYNTAAYYQLLSDLKFRENFIGSLAREVRSPLFDSMGAPPQTEKNKGSFDLPALLKRYKNKVMPQGAVDPLQVQAHLEGLTCKIFASFDVTEKGYLSLSDLEHVYDVSTCQRAFGLMDHENNGKITRDKMLVFFQSYFQERTELAAQISQTHELGGVVYAIVVCVQWAVVILGWLLVFGLNPAQVLVSFGTVLLTFAFAFGGVIKNIVTDLQFLLFVRPYISGDKVRLTADGLTLTVVNIAILATTFRDINNKVYIIPNHVLAEKEILNMTRSSSVVMETMFEVAFDTPAEKISAFTTQIQKILIEERLRWEEKCYVSINGFSHMTTMTVSLRITHRLGYARLPEVKNDYTALMHRVRAVMAKLEITWRTPLLTYTQQPSPGGKDLRGGASSALQVLPYLLSIP
eukprot:gb/GEZN01002666.1/.p1 GENE.gb/GEZN01002666.1/~~gb/GEZN01002666.1/.p1  ORF type:complete len:713 (+),score=68.48 gb/GEZN01002666.1/:125-2263(+)